MIFGERRWRPQIDNDWRCVRRKRAAAAVAEELTQLKDLLEQQRLALQSKNNLRIQEKKIFEEMT